MAKRTWRWVSQDEDCDVIDVWEGTKPPKITKIGTRAVYDSPEDFVPVCAHQFRILFGDSCTPKPGECFKVEFSGRRVKGGEA